MKRLLAIALFVALTCPALAYWQSRDSGYNVSVGSTYQGPGDVVSSATLFGSCSRAYSSATAAGTNMCDLVDSAAPTTVICTLQTGSNGLVNLTQTNCTGGVNASTKCAAATGGICNISKVYDQTGNGNALTQTSAALQLTLTFSALNSLPSMGCSNGAGNHLDTAANITVAQPMTYSGVYERTAAFTAPGNVLGASSGVTSFGPGGTAQSAIFAGTNVTQAAADSAWHALQGTLNNTSSAIMTDGTDLTSQSAGTGALSSSTLRLCRSGSAVSFTGGIMEVGLWPSAFTPTQRTNMNTNQHGTNGYNF